MYTRSSDRTIPKSPIPYRIKSLFHNTDGETWYSKSKLELVCSSPNIYFLKDFFNKSEIEYFDRVCTHCIGKFKASFTEDEENGEVISDERTSNYLHLTKAQDRVIRTIEQRAADLVGLNPTCVEPIQIVSYTNGQKFEVHHDAGTLHEDGSISLVYPRRLVTLFIYLNDLPEGEGHTEFPALNVSVRPTKGCGVMFANVLPNGECDPRTIHQANTVSAGLFKYGVNIWLCDTDLQDLAQVAPTVHTSKLSTCSLNHSVLTQAQRLTEEYIALKQKNGKKRPRIRRTPLISPVKTIKSTKSTVSKKNNEQYWDESEISSLVYSSDDNCINHFQESHESSTPVTVSSTSKSSHVCTPSSVNSLEDSWRRNYSDLFNYGDESPIIFNDPGDLEIVQAIIVDNEKQ